VTYSAPELSAERAIARRKLAKVLKCGGCGACLHRDKSQDAWDRGFCKVQGRTFPFCTKAGEPSFQLDETRLSDGERT
jgi:hypothetical protein